MSEVIIRVRVENKQAQAETVALDSKLKGVEGSAKKAGAAIDDAGKRSKVAGELMGGLRSIASDLGLAFGAAALLRGVVWMGQMSDASNRTKDALEGLAGSADEAERAIEGIERVTRGSVSETNAAALANRILGLEMAKTAEEAAEFARIGGLLGQVFDKSAQAGIENLTSAIANRSIVRLDTLGISSANVARRMEELAKQGYNVDEAFRLATLEEGRRKVEALEAAGVELGTSGDRARAAWENFATSLGGYVAPVVNSTAEGLAHLANLAAQGLDESASRTDAWTNAQGALRQSFAETGTDLERLNQMLFTYNNLLAAGDVSGAEAQQAAIAKTQQLLARSFLENAEAMNLTQGEAAALFQRMTGLNTAYVLLAGNTIVNRDATIDYAQAAYIAAQEQWGAANAGEALAIALQWIDRVSGGAENALAGLTGQAIGLAGGMNRALEGTIDLINGLLQLAGVESQISFSNKGGRNLDLGKTGGGVKNVVGGRVEAFRASQVDIGRIQRAGVSDAEKAAREIAEAYQRELDTIKSAAEQALNFSDAVDPLDPLLDEFGLRNEQEASEFARRMRAITNEALSTDGLTTAWKWVEMYKIEGDDLREIAANAEAARRAAVSGSDLSKLDKDAVANDVEEILAANANRQAFIDDVVARVQARTGAATAEIQKALGQNLGFAVVGAGETASADLLNSMQAGLVDGIQAERAAFEAVGADMMRWIVAGATAATANNGIIGKLKEAIEADILKLLAGANNGNSSN